jgi:2-oxoglutarate dehydrogenase E2 component (dihydrolipoamide succinyltransferase)
MATDIKIPAIGESIAEVQIAEWLVAEGDVLKKDQVIATIDSEKATVDLPAPEAGKLTKILKAKGSVAKIGESIGQIDGGDTTSPAAAPVAAAPAAEAPAKPAEAPAAEKIAAPATKEETRVMPAAERVLAETHLTAGEVPATGPGGRLLKEDVIAQVDRLSKPAPAAAAPESTTPAPRAAAVAGSGNRQEEIVPMTPLRRTVAKRLLEAQQTMAMLTTFNEIDMSTVMALRKEVQESFQKKHGVKVGFMSFFVRSVIEALKLVPQLNAEIRGNDIVYHHYYDIGVAIGAGKGLVVPPVRNAEKLGFAQIEKVIADYATRAQANKLKLEELQGGTFTVSNGGVYGSMLSTPIINPPQSGILGLHAIQERPVAHEGQVVIRPMMYVALSYDHRIVDGREAVFFLKRVKELMENPTRMLLDV